MFEIIFIIIRCMFYMEILLILYYIFFEYEYCYSLKDYLYKLMNYKFMLFIYI